MAERFYDGFEEELGGLPFEEASVDATASPSPIAVSATLPAAAPQVGSTPAPAVIAVTATIPAVTALGGGDAAAFPNPITTTATLPAAAAQAGSAPAPSPIAVTATIPAVTAQAGSTPAPSPIAVTATLPLVAVTDGTDVVGLLVAQVTAFPDRIGVTVSADDATDAHTVVSGVSSRTAGAGAVLTGDFGFRGLYAFTVDADTPGNFPDDGRDWVTLAGWGTDFELAVRRNYANAFDLRVEFETAAAASAYATSSFIVDDYASLGFAVTRDPTTGLISLYRSDDGWETWSAMPISTSSMPTGALDDFVGNDPIVLLDGDLQDGPWVQVFAAQWSATTDLDDFDAEEVTAFNYGSNLVTGVGGDFFDGFDGTTKDAWEHAGRSSYAYKLRYQTTDAGTTVRVDWTVNAPTLATGDPTAGTEAAFTFDMTPQFEGGPAESMLLPPIQFESTSQYDIHNFGYSPSGGGFGTYDAQGQRPQWRAILCDMNGVPSLVVEKAIIEAPTWSLNEHDTWDVTIPIYDPAIALIRCPYTEVQIWRGDQLLMWGPMWRARAENGGAAIRYQCKGTSSYLDHRYIGVTPPNYIIDPSFENGGVSWIMGAYSLFEPTAKRNPAYWDTAVSSERSVAGTPGRSLRMSSTDDMTFGIITYQFFWHEIDPAEWPDGIVWTASAWVYVPSAEWVKERNVAYNGEGESAPSGLHLSRFSTTEWVPGTVTLPKLHDAKVASIDEDIPKDTWVRLEVSLNQPAEATPRTDWIQLELHCPVGTVFWDEVKLSRDERLFFDDVDQATIVQTLVEHAQDTAYGKSDVNLTTDCPATGVLRSRTYEFFNHQFIAPAIDEFTSLWNGLDWSVQVTKDSRVFNTHYPMKGTRRPAHPLLAGKNIADIVPQEDGEQTATTITMLADSTGTGSGRDEVTIADTSLSGGLVLESTLNAAKESPLATLTDQARRAWRVAQDTRIPDLLTYEARAGELLGAIHTGDVVWVDASKGEYVLYGWFRVMSMQLDPKTETLRIGVNPFDDYIDPAVG